MSVAAALGVAATAGAVAATPLSAPVAASAASLFGPLPALTATAASAGIESLTTSTDDARASLDAGRAAQAEVEALTSEIAASGLDVGDASIDTSRLERAVARLDDADIVPVLLFPVLATEVDDRTDAVTSRLSEVRASFDQAKAAKAEADAAAEAERQAAAAAQAAAEALARANTPEGAQATAAQLASSRYGWGGDQFGCLVSLWQKESNWNYRAYNPSGATGIPQALPGSKMAAAGADWATSAATQVSWGLDYISRAYGTPCSAWAHSQSMNWY